MECFCVRRPITCYNNLCSSGAQRACLQQDGSLVRDKAAVWHAQCATVARVKRKKEPAVWLQSSAAGACIARAPDENL